MAVLDFIDVDEVRIGLFILTVESDLASRNAVEIFLYFGQSGDCGKSRFLGVIIPERESDDGCDDKNESRNEDQSAATGKSHRFKFFVFVDEEKGDDVPEKENEGDGDVGERDRPIGLTLTSDHKEKEEKSIEKIENYDRDFGQSFFDKECNLKKRDEKKQQENLPAE